MKASKKLRGKLSVLYLLLLVDFGLYFGPVEASIYALFILFAVSILVAIQWTFDALD